MTFPHTLTLTALALSELAWAVFNWKISRNPRNDTGIGLLVSGAILVALPFAVIWKVAG